MLLGANETQNSLNDNKLNLFFKKFWVDFKITSSVRVRHNETRRARRDELISVSRPRLSSFNILDFLARPRLSSFNIFVQMATPD